MSTKPDIRPIVLSEELRSKMDKFSINLADWFRERDPERDWNLAYDENNTGEEAFAKLVRDEWAEKWSKDLFDIGEGKDPNPFEYGMSGDGPLDDFIKDKKFKWIPYVELKDVEKIGSGGFGEVYKASWTRKNEKVEKVALKCLSETNLEKFLEEWNNHAKFLYSYEIINVIGFTKDTKGLHMAVMAYANGGTLRSNLKKISKSSWKQKLYILYKIVSGLHEVHENKLIHRDLHDANILINKVVDDDEEGEFKLDRKDDVCICDLGICQAIDSSAVKNDKNGIYGNIPFMAPEIFESGKCSAASDMYSFAMIMWELTSGVQPFNSDGAMTVLTSATAGTRPEIIHGTPPCYVKLMKLCWDPDPSKRPSAHDMLIYIMHWIFPPPDDCKIKSQLANDIIEFIEADRQPAPAATQPPAATQSPTATQSPAQSNYSTSRIIYPSTINSLQFDI